MVCWIAARTSPNSPSMLEPLAWRVMLSPDPSSSSWARMTSFRTETPTPMGMI